MSKALDAMRERLTAQTRTFLLQSAELWRGDVTRRFGHGPITTRSGRLQGSLAYKLNGTGVQDFELRMVSAGVPYATTMERGGTIKAKKKYLTIPLAAAKTAAGVTRIGFREWLDGAKRSGKVAWIRKGNGWVIVWTPQGQSKGTAFWKLQPSVTIPGPRTGEPSKLGFFETWKATAPKREVLMRRLLGARAIWGPG